MGAATAYRRWGHRRVDGWIEPPVLDVVAALTQSQHRLGVRGSVAEIGVHHGRLFLGMHLCRAAGERSLAVDLFDDQSRNVDRSGRGDEAVFRAHLARVAGGSDGVTVVAGDSTRLSGADVVRLVGPVRMFDVDGGHTAEIVEHDMRTAADSLVDGGIVLGDDYFNPQWPGVAEGTLAFLDGQDRLVPFAIGFNKVMLADPDHAESYRAALGALAERRLWAAKTSSLRSHPVLVVWKREVRRRARPAAKQVLAATGLRRPRPAAAG